ncbi:MAG: pyridoxamine 5'-phosphate oxidase [Pseudomonadales bacterium]
MSREDVDLTAIRREYVASGLDRTDLQACPVTQFELWFEAAKQGRLDDVSSMTLATASASGMPSARIVLLKHFSERGFCWYTDYESQKGRELAENPQAELMFYWYGLERQVRIQGIVHKLTPEDAQTYFLQRPVGSRLSAAASHQSAAIDSRQTLEQKVAQLEQSVGDSVERPARWGGYCLQPTQFEFWQGRESRLHDRFQYRLDNGQWDIQRLQP